jgi:LysM repeat protein
MLTATTTATESRARATGDIPGRPPSVQVVVRRRRVVTTLAASATASALAASAGLTALWWLTLLFVALGGAYLGLVARLRHVRVRREMDLAFGTDTRAADEFDWRGLEKELHLSLAGAEPVAAPTAVEVGNRAIGRFLLCWALGWLLTPLVTVLRLVRGELTPGQRQGLADQIVRWQQYGRSQSLRLLTVGAAASVGITAVGGLTTISSASALPAVAVVSTTTQAAVAPASYTVVPGDTLSAIARRSGTTVAALAATNHLADPNLIFPGQVLSVTGSNPAGTVAPATAAMSSYTVRPGDTLSAIARGAGTTVAALAASNHLADPNLLFPGQVLSVPVSAAPATPVAARAAVAGLGGRYTVQPGDTLAALARRTHTTIGALAAANHLANPNLILPGQVLAVPATAPAAAPVAAQVTATVTPAPAPPASTAAAPAPPAAPSALPMPLQYLRGGSVDQGVDYSAPGGTPLYAMGPGKIIRAGMTGFGPNCPVLQITGGPLAGKTVYYGHAGANLVAVGATVAAGQQISIVGYGIVGYSTGPHLEVGFYPPGGNGSGGAMLAYINGAVGHSTGG